MGILKNLFASNFKKESAKIARQFELIEESYEKTDCIEEIVLSKNDYTIKFSEDLRERSFVVNVKEKDNYILKAGFRNIYSFNEKYDVSVLKADLSNACYDLQELKAYVDFFKANNII